MTQYTTAQLQAERDRVAPLVLAINARKCSRGTLNRLTQLIHYLYAIDMELYRRAGK